MASHKKLIVFLAILSVVAVVASVLLLPRVPVRLGSGTALPQPRPLGEFTLTDHHRQPFTRAAFENHWSLVFLGFTHCPDICPTTLSLLTAIDTRMRASGRELQTVFLSADPERDTPEVLSGYLAHFDPRFVGVTGGKAELDRLCANLGLGYVKNPGANGDYTVDHSAALVLIDPRARVAAYFQPPLDVARVAADLSAIIR